MTRYRLVACSDGPLSDTQLAEAVAERIFQIGKEYGVVPHRVEYKIMFEGREFGVGGLAREPFTECVRQAIDSAMSSAKGAGDAWQLVSDKLPATTGSYIGTVTGRPWDGVTHTPIAREVYFNGEGWTNDECVALTVTHWQPLPAPPSAKGEV